MNEPLELNISTDSPLTEKDLKSLVESKLYTLFMPDFLKMPDMDFVAVSKLDPEVRVLFN